MPLVNASKSIRWTVFTIAIGFVLIDVYLAFTYANEYYGNNEAYQYSRTAYKIPALLIDKIGGIIRYIGAEGFTAIATIFIAAFTFTLYRATTGQLLQLRESVDLARNDFISSHRPKIRIKHFRVSGEIMAERQIRIQLVIVNSGITAAILSHHSFYMGTIENGEKLPRFQLYIGRDHPLDYLYLASGITQPILIDGETLTKKQIGRIMNREKILYCAGSITYLDESRRFRTTAYYRFFDPESGRFYLPGKAQEPDTDYEYED